MADQRLVEYIKSELSRGISTEQIRQILLETGWQESDVNEGFGAIGQQNIQQADGENNFAVLSHDTNAQQPEITAVESVAGKEKTVKSRKSIKSRKIDTSYHQSLTGGWRVKDFGVGCHRSMTDGYTKSFHNKNVETGVAQVAEQPKQFTGIQPVIETKPADVQITTAQTVQSGKSKPLSLDLIKVTSRVRSKKFIMILGAMMAGLIFVGVFTFYTIGSGVPSAKFTKEAGKGDVPDAVLQELDAAMEESNQQLESVSIQETSQDMKASTNIQPINVVGCGTDMDCFIQFSQFCEYASVRDSAVVNKDGIDNIQITYYEIREFDGNRCALYLRLERSDLYKELADRSGTCKFNIGDLVSMLIRWKNKDYSSDDFSVAECQGDYFS